MLVCGLCRPQVPRSLPPPSMLSWPAYPWNGSPGLSGRRTLTLGMPKERGSVCPRIRALEKLLVYCPQAGLRPSHPAAYRWWAYRGKGICRTRIGGNAVPLTRLSGPLCPSRDIPAGRWVRPRRPGRGGEPTRAAGVRAGHFLNQPGVWQASACRLWSASSGRSERDAGRLRDAAPGRFSPALMV